MNLKLPIALATLILLVPQAVYANSNGESTDDGFKVGIDNVLDNFETGHSGDVRKEKMSPTDTAGNDVAAGRSSLSTSISPEAPTAQPSK